MNVPKNLNPLTALGLLTAVLVVISNLFGGGDSSETKSEWKQRVTDTRAASIRINQIVGSKKQFTEIMGQPDEIESQGDREWWFYDCQDGVIEIEMSRFTGGALVGELNEQ